MDDETLDRGLYAMGFGNVEYNIRQLEKVATTKKEKRTVQSFGAFLGVREYPKPDMKWRVLMFVWTIESCIKWPYWKMTDWLKDRKERGEQGV